MAAMPADYWLQPWLELWRRPEVVEAKAFFVQLGGISGGYWLISSFLGHTAEAIHDRLIHELAILFAISYNILLAVVYSMVMALPVFLYGDGTFWRKAVGFIVVYIALKGVYVDEHAEEADDYSVWGLVMGLWAFLSFAVFPEPLRNPLTEKVYSVASGIAASWVGTATTAFAFGRVFLIGLRWLRRQFLWKPRLRGTGRSPWERG